MLQRLASRMLASWLWHWGHIIFPAVSMLPLITTVCPLTFQKHFFGRMLWRSWDPKRAKGNKHARSKRMRTKVYGPSVYWHHLELVSVEDNNVDPIREHLNALGFNNKRATIVQVTFEPSYLPLLSTIQVCKYWHHAGVLHPLRPNTGRFIPARNFHWYVWHDL